MENTSGWTKGRKDKGCVHRPHLRAHALAPALPATGVRAIMRA
jgi:hypothetical protein